MIIIEIKLIIENIDNKKIYTPVIKDSVKWTTDIIGCAGTLNFEIIKKDEDIDINNKLALNFREGNVVKLFVNGLPIFCGFVFTKNRDKSNIINVTAFDQLRYLKNKDTYIYQNLTASELINIICKDYNIVVGDIDDTPFVIYDYIEQNSTLFDIINNALNVTYKNTNQYFVLFDDFGKISLKNINNMKLNLKIDDTVAQNFNCETSIDNDTYNRVKLVYSDKRKKESSVFIKQNDYSVNKYGVLQYFENVSADENCDIKAESILNNYSEKSRVLSVKNVFGDLNVRAGCMIMVCLNVGDVIINDWFVVKKCTHHFNSNLHTMDLELFDNLRKI